MNEIRFDLEDILDADLVDDILYSINMMSEKMQFKQVIFWHNGKINNVQIKNFMIKIQDIIKNDVPFKISVKRPQLEYAWFDVISDQKVNGSKSRFSYIYPVDKKSEMINGIHSFFNVVSFIENSKQGNRVYYKPKEDGK